MDFRETEEQQALRKAVAALGGRYGHEYTAPLARAREPLAELWSETGKSGFIGLNLPEEYGGGGAGMYELSIVGDNLLHDHHPEFGDLKPREEYRRSAFGQVTWRF